MERLYKGFECMQNCFHPQNQQRPLVFMTSITVTLQKFVILYTADCKQMK